MCNLYSITHSADAMIEFLSGWQEVENHAGNMEPMSGIYPDYAAPIVRHGTSCVEIAKARWGLPNPAIYVKDGVDRGTTNVRNTASRHWRQWLVKPELRCLVPLSSFAEPDQVGGTKANHWFALSDERPLGFFAGVWTPFSGIRKKSEGPVDADVFGFLTTEANADVGRYHDKAMPVILRTTDECRRWMEAPIDKALELQCPLSDGALKVVQVGGKSDKGTASR